MSTEQKRPPNAGTTGHFRVVLWFSGWAAVLLFAFVYRLDSLRPNWLILAPLMLVPFALGPKAFRDLLTVKSGGVREHTAQIASAVGAVLATAAILYCAWRFGARTVVQIIDAYVLPAFIPLGFAFAGAALYVERKFRVRVFVGNRGWLYLPLPSNSTVERDARKSGARPSL